LLEKIEEGKTILQFRKDAAIFSQGDSVEAIYFIQTGKVKIAVVSPGGKEAVLAMLGAHGFFGEGCLVGQTLSLSTATAMQASTLFRIERRAMLRALRELSEKFTGLLLSRNIDLEEDLCDQLFNHSEKRLARVLLKLARFGQDDTMAAANVPPINHETLAEMVGTTRSRVTLHEQIQEPRIDRLQHGENYRESGITDRRGPARLNRSSRLSPKDVTGR
jgi:CRP/FNR family cyclic AMP-dependent transcriptional regulator